MIFITRCVFYHYSQSLLQQLQQLILVHSQQPILKTSKQEHKLLERNPQSDGYHLFVPSRCVRFNRGLLNYQRIRERMVNFRGTAYYTFSEKIFKICGSGVNLARISPRFWPIALSVVFVSFDKLQVYNKNGRRQETWWIHQDNAWPQEEYSPFPYQEVPPQKPPETNDPDDETCTPIEHFCSC